MVSSPAQNYSKTFWIVSLTGRKGQLACSFAARCATAMKKVPRLSGRRHRRRGHERAMAHGRVALGPSAARMRPNTLPIVRRSQPFAPREALGAAAGWCAPTAFGRGPCRRLLRPHGRAALTAARRPNTPEHARIRSPLSTGLSRRIEKHSVLQLGGKRRPHSAAGRRSQPFAPRAALGAAAGW